MTPGGAGPRPARTIFLGSGPFGLAALHRLRDHPAAELVAVVTGPPRPAGRGLRATSSPVALAADAVGIPVLAPPKLRSPEAIAAVGERRPELLVLADYGQLVPAPLLDVAHGALNLHPSLLPRHRGASPIQATLIDGDRESGVTIIRMDEGLDTGPIVAAESIELAGTETTPELEARLAGLAADLLARTIGPWLGGTLRAVPQPVRGATMTRPLRRADGRLDPGRPAAELERRVRALQPWPGAHLDTVAGRLSVRRASSAPGEAGDEPGTLVADGRDLALATVDGRLRLLEVVPAGGRPMSGEALLRGRTNLPGSRVSRPDATMGDR